MLQRGGRVVVWAALALGGGCTFEASTAVISGGDSGVDTGTGALGSTAEAGDEEADSLGDADEDGDGVTVAEGDCDDGDPSVFPGQVDGCDGRDEDCDGAVDEDARDADPYEDNDDVAVFLGDLSGGGSASVEALLDAPGDVDRFSFSTDDSGWSTWALTVRLSNIPDGYRWRLTVTAPDGERSSTSGAGSLTVEAEDDLFVDDAGLWEVQVDAIDGAPCDALYLLTVDFDG